MAFSMESTRLMLGDTLNHMADTSAQREIDKWITETFLPKKTGEGFSAQSLPLESGGSHRFAAVNSTGRKVGVVCTGSAMTAGGKLATGKLMKIRADMYFLLLAQADERFLVFVDQSMYSLMLKERQTGKVPKNIQFMLVDDLPEALAEALRQSQQAASEEVSPA